jgi:succinoglycan biosynthesis protein ExoO
MQPDVSVIIAAFNAEATIAEAICSALDQEEVAVEVVVVDDASQDRTGPIARSFPADAVKVVELPENRGPGGARNVALTEATGRWIAVLDADDAMRADRLARVIAKAQAANAEMAVDNLMVIESPNGGRQTMFAPELLERIGEISLADFIRSNLLFKSRFNFGYMKPVVARTFIEKHSLRYDETLRIGEDYIFFASALAAGARCVVEPAAGYLYRVRAGSASHVLERHHVEAMLSADAAFVRANANALDGEARAALDLRRRSLEQAISFLSLVRNLKDRALFKAAGDALRDPAALKHLKMPIGVRLRRLAGPPYPRPGR